MTKNILSNNSSVSLRRKIGGIANILVLAASASLLFSTSAQAAGITYTWNSTSSNTWNIAGNWTPSSGASHFPGNTTSDVASFVDPTSSGLATTVTLTGSVSFADIVFTTGTGGYTIGSSSDGYTMTLSNATPIAFSTGSGTNTINENLIFDNNASGSDNINNLGTGSLVIGGTISGLGGANTALGSNITTLSLQSAGKITLTGTNTFTNNTLIYKSGGVSVSVIGNSGASGNLGEGTTINLGSGTNIGVLYYTGVGETTSKVINLNGTTGEATIDSSGSGALIFSSAFTATGAGAKTLTLQGSYSGGGYSTNNNIEGAIVDSTGKTSLTKSGTGTWILSGTNTYTGATTVSGGMLEFANAASLYNSSTPTAANLVTASGATTTFDVGTGGFNSGQINSLNTALITNATSTTGFKSGSTIGFDTTGQDFSYSTVIANAAGGSNTLGLIKLGTNSLTLGNENTYSGGTTVSAGTLYVNNSSGGSGTGTGFVSVGSGAQLAGSGYIQPGTTATGAVSVGAGGSLFSGSSPASYSTSTTVVTGGAGAGLTIDNSVAGFGTGKTVTSILSISGTNSLPANLTFALGTGTNSNGSSALSFASPNMNSSYMNVLGNTAGEINFSGTDTVTIQDMTNYGSLTTTLGLKTPYLLIQTLNGGTPTGLDTMFTGLVTSTGPNGTGTLQLDQNGYVVGVGTSTTSFTAINIIEDGANGSALPNGESYTNAQLYLYNGDLEVVPEPGTWAMMLGGLALLVVIQRRSRLS